MTMLSSLSPEEMTAIARDIDRVTAELSKIAILKTASHQGCAMGLALGAAQHVIHGGGSEEDFLVVMRAAWERALKLHTGSGN